MYAHAQSIWWPRLATFVLSLLAAGSVVYWGLKLSASSRPVSVQPAQAAGPMPVDAGALARLLGGGALPTTAPAPSASSRFTLAGIVTEGAHAGAALIAVDGRPAKPFRVGARVDDNLVLQSVAPRSVNLGASTDAPASITLELPLRR